MEIILLRQGKPLIPLLDRINAISFIQWIEAYNSAGLCLTSPPPQTTLTRVNQGNATVCSQLSRSIQSAEALNITNIILTDAQFNEAGLPSANWRRLKLSPTIWLIIFRLLWLFGYSKHSESYNEAKQRAAGSTKTLINLAGEYKSVLFIGLNIYLKKVSMINYLQRN